MDTLVESITVHCAENCGNAPKKLLLKDYTISLAKNEIEFCLDQLHEQISWDIIGQKQLKGIDEVKFELEQMNVNHVKILQIDNIITHGNSASVNGMFSYQQGQSYAFCDVYQFTGFSKTAKIKKISSYLVQLTSSDG